MYPLEVVSTTVHFNWLSCSAVVFFCSLMSNQDYSVGKDKYCVSLVRDYEISNMAVVTSLIPMTSLAPGTWLGFQYKI